MYDNGTELHLELTFKLIHAKYFNSPKIELDAIGIFHTKILHN